MLGATACGGEARERLESIGARNILTALQVVHGALTSSISNFPIGAWYRQAAARR